MIERNIKSQAIYLLKHFPAVALLGPRQAGKTTLAKEISKSFGEKTIYFDLENDRDLFRFEQNAQNTLEEYINHLVIIDEIQRLPRLFALLRSMIDLKRKPSRYLLLGSASPDLIKGVTESLAGRISYINLYPINLSEARSKNIKLKQHWFRGGYPESLLAKNNNLSLRWLDDYIKSYIERDLAQVYGIQLPSITIRNFWRMLASSNGSIWNGESYARALGITGTTVHKYLDLLEGAFLVHRLQPWFLNVKKRVIKSPKIYISDSGILHRLNNFDSMSALEGHLIIGASWEGYVIQQLIELKSEKVELFYYRTQHGAECDLVFVKGNKIIAIAEIKYSETPSVSRGFYECVSDLRPEKKFIITPGNGHIKGEDGIHICGLEYFLSELLSKM